MSSRRAKGEVSYNGTTRWVYVGTLQYDGLGRDGRTVVPAGTHGVSIAFRSAPWCHNHNGRIERGNLYMVRGKVK